MQIENYIWTEKYRPKKVENVIGDFKEKIIKYLEDEKTIPHMIFYSSSAGTGKTSSCKAIINELDADALFINSSDDRKIDVVRDKIKSFVSTMSTNGKRRIVFLDEADGMLPASQDALRNMMEYYSANAIFLLTCNNIEKIIDPLRSRCLEVPLKFPSKQEIYCYLQDICVAENMKYTQEGITQIMNMHYPNIRNCVIQLQDLHTMNLDVIPENIKLKNGTYDRIWNFINEKRWHDVKEEIFKNNLDAREINMYIWNKIMEADNPNLKMLQICCRNERDMSYGADPKIVFVTSLIELIK